MTPDQWLVIAVMTLVGLVLLNDVLPPVDIRFKPAKKKRRKRRK